MIDVGSEDSFDEGTVTIVQAGKQEVGIIRWGGQFYAIRNVCPHQLGPVCKGMLRPLLVAPETGPGTFVCDMGRPVITCPWHGWEFYVETGSAVWNSHYKVRTYPVRVESGRVCVEVTARTPAGAA